MGRRPWNEELDAAGLLADLLSGEVHARDPGGGAQQLHDFDVRLTDGRTIAVEVTRANVPSELAKQGAIDKLDWTTSLLANDWHLGTPSGISVKDLHAEAAHLLHDLERDGITSGILSSYDEDRVVHPSLRRLEELGVRLAYMLSPAEDGVALIDVGESARVGSTAMSLVVALASEAANRSDNAKKLTSASADERHLFIWVESSRSAVTVQMFVEPNKPIELPTEVPDLPAAVDCVWMATGFEAATVWSYSGTGGWMYHGVWSRTETPGRTRTRTR